MRIAFVVHKFPPESLGGTEIYTWSLARALVQAGHEIHVFYPLLAEPGTSVSSRVERDGIHLWRVVLAQQPESAPRQFWHTFRHHAVERAFPEFLRTVQPDVVHFQHVQGVSARLLEMATGVPTVLTLHDYWYFCANSQLLRPDGRVCAGPRWGWNCVDCATVRADLRVLRYARPIVALPFVYRNAYLRRLLARVSIFIAPSHFLRQQYIAHGFPPQRILVLENGLDTSRLNGNIPLPPPPTRPHFGFLGSLAWQKGVHVLIEAFNRLPPDAAALTIYGSEKAFPEYAASLRKRARHPHIRFAGAIDYRATGAALRQIDCLVVPSLWFENSPLVIQEAYAMKVPVVASRLGALVEKVIDGKTGRLFPPGDVEALTNILHDIIAHPHQLAAMRAQIPPVVTIETHAEQLLVVYNRLCRGENVPSTLVNELAPTLET